METLLTVLLGIVVVVGWGAFMFFCISATSTKGSKTPIDRNHVNDNSFQNFAKFYGEVLPSDKDFDRKVELIYLLIENQKIMNIQEIAARSNCTIPECVLKIRYLKNKRILGDYYVDTVNLKLLSCSPEDQKLLEKYKPHIYGTHSQINEIAQKVSNPRYLNPNDLREEVYQEIKSLNDKGLLNGIKIDEIDRRIIYYTIEKRKTVFDMETVHCKNCGALNDVDKKGKVRCGYCNTIVYGSELYEKEM